MIGLEENLSKRFMRHHTVISALKLSQLVFSYIKILPYEISMRISAMWRQNPSFEVSLYLMAVLFKWWSCTKFSNEYLGVRYSHVLPFIISYFSWNNKLIFYEEYFKVLMNCCWTPSPWNLIPLILLFPAEKRINSV